MDDRRIDDLDSGLERMEFETTSGPIWVHKAPYGKLEGTGPPKSYKSVDPEIKVLDASADRSENMLSFTTIPWSTGAVDIYDLEGSTEWIVRGNTKSKVLKYPGFPRSVSKIPHPTTSCEVRKADGMGLGLFATRDLDIGELIFAERPLLLAPRTLNYAYAGRTEALENYTSAQYMQIQLFEAERFFQVALRRMTNERQREYMSLANTHKEDGSGPCVGVFRTNVYAVENICDGPDGTPTTDINGYAAVGVLGSRINHSCVPNVSEVFDVASFSLQFYATRKIQAGEQFFYSYHGHALKPSKERQKILDPYGIVCKCPLCTTATPESERRLQDIHLRRHFVCVYVALCLLRPYVRKKATSRAGIAQTRELGDLIKKLEDMRQELESVGQYCYEPLLVFLHKLYLRVGKLEEARALAKDIVRFAALDLLLEKMGNAKPISSKIYPLSKSEQVELDNFLDEHLRSGRIRPSKSEMASPFFFVKKKDGSLRPVQDYRRLVRQVGNSDDNRISLSGI